MIASIFSSLNALNKWLSLFGCWATAEPVVIGRIEVYRKYQIIGDSGSFSPEFNSEQELLAWAKMNSLGLAKAMEGSAV